MAARNVVETYKAWPKWARIAAPVTASFLAIAAIGSATEDEPESTTTTTAVAEPPLAITA